MARVPQLYAIPRPQQAPAATENPFSDRSVPSPSSALHAPQADVDRNSANLSSIGGLLLGGGQGAKAVHQDEEQYIGVDKNSLHARVMRDMVDSAYEPAYDEPTPKYEMYDDHKARASRSLNKNDALPGTPMRGNAGALPRLQMPAPSVVPVGPPTPSTPTHPNGVPAGHPMFSPGSAHGHGHGHGATSLYQPQPQRPVPQALVPHDTGTVMPPNTLPVAPLLAAPPRAHFSPMTPPASPSSKAIGAIEAGVDSPLSGFDQMREKGTCFREGEDEVLTSFSPRITGERPRVRTANHNPSGRKSAFRPLSTVDFWKRMSVVAKTHDPRKESEWIRSKQRSIWKNPMFVVPLSLTLIAVAAVVIWAVVKVSATPST